MDLEIPVGKRKPFYRFLEMLPGMLSYGVIILLILLSIFNPLLASVYLLVLISMALIKIFGISYHMLVGRTNMEKACRVDWSRRLHDLEDPAAAHARLLSTKSEKFEHTIHLKNLQSIIDEPSEYPKPSQIYNAIIMPAYNESIEIIEPAVQSLLDTTYDLSHLIVVFAYEERGGAEIKKTAETLQKKYNDTFHSFHIVEHPKGIEHEVIGKGGNITHAGRWLKSYLGDLGIAFSQVLVTTMDCDNKPHPTYFDYITYEYIVYKDRKNLSYQPIALFTNNIWDVPAPMRVIATGNSFWNIVSSMRPYALRNFASHAQPMDALVEMDFWSVRTIVEDGHQYWRSYFHFDGKYGVVPIYAPIYQDAVLSETYKKTLKAQFVQLRRWAYGASDVAYVGSRVFSSKRRAPFWPSLTRFLRLLDGHVTLAYVALVTAFGAWLPLLLNPEAVRNIDAHQLPGTISLLQTIALLGMVIAIFSSFKILPPRPARYKKRRTFLMLIQWILMPVTSILYSSMAAYAAQTKLMTGRYLDKFDVTEKLTVDINDRLKAERNRLKGDQDGASK